MSAARWAAAAVVILTFAMNVGVPCGRALARQPWPAIAS